MSGGQDGLKVGEDSNALQGARLILPNVNLTNCDIAHMQITERVPVSIQEASKQFRLGCAKGSQKGYEGVMATAAEGMTDAGVRI